MTSRDQLWELLGSLSAVNSGVPCILQYIITEVYSFSTWPYLISLGRLPILRLETLPIESVWVLQLSSTSNQRAMQEFFNIQGANTIILIQQILHSSAGFLLIFSCGIQQNIISHYPKVQWDELRCGYWKYPHSKSRMYSPGIHVPRRKEKSGGILATIDLTNDVSISRHRSRRLNLSSTDVPPDYR